MPVAGRESCDRRGRGYELLPARTLGADNTGLGGMEARSLRGLARSRELTSSSRG
jgi:hypothetical protein